MRNATMALLLGIAACSTEPRGAAQLPTPADDQPPAAAPAPETTEAMNTLAGRLRWEAEHRPGAPLATEQVLTALAAAGLSIDAPKQYLGLTARARYCAGGTTAGGLAVAVCEYGSADEAAAARTYVLETFAAMNPNREIHVRGATTLTLSGSGRLGDDARRAAAVFANL
jgi:hypothetical protein